MLLLLKPGGLAPCQMCSCAWFQRPPACAMTLRETAVVKCSETESCGKFSDIFETSCYTCRLGPLMTSTDKCVAVKDCPHLTKCKLFEHVKNAGDGRTLRACFVLR